MPTADQFQPLVAYDKTVTIASGQTTSGAVDLAGCTLLGFFMPSTFDGTTLTITASTTEGGTYVTVQSLGSDYTITTAASKYTPIENLAITAGLRFIKLVAGTSQSTTDTIITLALRPV